MAWVVKLLTICIVTQNGGLVKSSTELASRITVAADVRLVPIKATVSGWTGTSDFTLINCSFTSVDLQTCLAISVSKLLLSKSPSA